MNVSNKKMPKTSAVAIQLIVLIYYYYYYQCVRYLKPSQVTLFRSY